MIIGSRSTVCNVEQSQEEAPFMRRRDTEVEVENGTVLRVKACVSARDLDAWKIVMEKGKFPCLDFNSQEKAEEFQRRAQERFPAARISLAQSHPAEWTVFAHK